MDPKADLQIDPQAEQEQGEASTPAKDAAQEPADKGKLGPLERETPRKPVNTEVCENIIKHVVDTSFKDFKYRPKEALFLSSDVSKEIKDRVKAQNFDCYKLVCVVSVGEKLVQGYSHLNCSWDKEHDGYLTYKYDTPNYYVMATLYYVFFN